MIFGTLKQFLVKSFWFQEKQTPERYIVDILEAKQVTIVQYFFLLASVIIQSGDINREIIFW